MKMRAFRFIWLWLVPLFFGVIGPAEAGGDYSLEAAYSQIMQGGEYRRHLTGAKHRVAVFSFEDPQNTGRGNDVALLMARHILFSNSYLPIGVLNFKQDLAPAQPGDLSYFDKVDRVIKEEKVTMAVWGRVLPLGDRLLIDTYIQLPRETIKEFFRLRISLPKAMGGKILQAHIRPDRIHVQRISCDVAQQMALIDFANFMRELRQSPDLNSKVVGNIPQDKTFTIVTRKPDWIQVQIRGGSRGWMPEIIDFEGLPLFAAASFASGVFGFAANGGGYVKQGPDLTPEAIAVADQLKLLHGVYTLTRDRGQEIIRRWIGPQRQTGRDPSTGIDYGEGNPPGGAAFANLQALALIADSLWKCGRAKMAGGFSREEIKKTIEETLSRSLPKKEADRISNRISKKLEKIPANIMEGNLDDFFLDKIDKELYTSVKGEKAADLYGALKEAVVAPIHDGCKLDPGYVRDIATQLAQSSLEDPGNVDVLNNLAVLFDYLGDVERKNLAETIAAQVSASQ